MNLKAKLNHINTNLHFGSPFLWWSSSIIFVSIAIFALNILTPFIADDLAYIYYFGAGQPKSIDNFSDLVGSQINHYNMWGGRVVVHGIAQTLLQLPLAVLAILKTCVYLVFVYLIYKHITGYNKSHSLSLFWLINLGIWFFIPSFGDTILWTTGSANYLWGTSIILCFLLPYRLHKPQQICTKWQTFIYSILMLALGVIAGCTNENTAAGMLVIATLFVYVAYMESKKISQPLSFGITGALLGYVVMIIAPGNFSRTSAGVTITSIVKQLIFSTYELLFTYGWLLIIILTLATIYYKTEQIRSLRTNTLKQTSIYFTGAMVAIYVMILSPQFPERAWFGVVSFLFIVLGIFVYSLQANTIVKQLKTYSIIIGSAAFLLSYAFALTDILKVNKESKQRILIAKEARAKGQEKAYFNRINIQSRYVHNEDEESNFLLSYYYDIFIEYNK